MTKWIILFQYDFAEEFETLEEEVQIELLAMVEHLEKFGPTAKRPQVDTLKGSKIANLKEFRFEAAPGASLLPSTGNEEASSSPQPTNRVGVPTHSTDV